MRRGPPKLKLHKGLPSWPIPNIARPIPEIVRPIPEIALHKPVRSVPKYKKMYHKMITSQRYIAYKADLERVRQGVDPIPRYNPVPYARLYVKSNEIAVQTEPFEPEISELNNQAEQENEPFDVDHDDSAEPNNQTEQQNDSFDLHRDDSFEPNNQSDRAEEVMIEWEPITYGPRDVELTTGEKIDDVRFISNMSEGQKTPKYEDDPQICTPESIQKLEVTTPPKPKCTRRRHKKINQIARGLYSKLKKQ